MYFVYILRSKIKNTKYIGVTSNLRRRVYQHNKDGKKFTSKYKDYRLVWFCCLNSKNKAYDFERYLKSSSGYAFSNKRLL